MSGLIGDVYRFDHCELFDTVAFQSTFGLTSNYKYAFI